MSWGLQFTSCWGSDLYYETGEIVHLAHYSRMEQSRKKKEISFTLWEELSFPVVRMQTAWCWYAEVFHGLETWQLLFRGKNSFKDVSVLSLAPGSTHQWATECPKSVSHQSWCLQSMSVFHGTVPTNSLKQKMEYAKCRNKQKHLNPKTQLLTFPHCPTRKRQNWTHVKIYSSW